MLYLDLHLNQLRYSIKKHDLEIEGSEFKTKKNLRLRERKLTNYFPMKQNRKYMIHTVTNHGA